MNAAVGRAAVVNRLLYANLKGHAQSLDEVQRLLTELKTAWETLERQSHSAQTSERTDATRSGPRPALSYGKA